jgi:Down syndrome cell adhesion molecule
MFFMPADVWHEHNAQQIIPGDKTAAAVEGLKPATMYQFRLYAENQLGSSEPSDILHVSFIPIRFSLR